MAVIALLNGTSKYVQADTLDINEKISGPSLDHLSATVTEMSSNFDSDTGDIVVEPKTVNIDLSKELLNYENMVDGEANDEDPFDTSRPERLLLTGEFAKELMERVEALNEDFLEQSQF